MTTLATRRISWLLIMIGLMLLIVACTTQDSSVVANPAVTTAALAAPAPTARPTHDPAVVLVSWRDMSGLSRTHLLSTTQKFECVNCHTLKDETNQTIFQPPPDEVCLGCHEGSVAKLMLLKNAEGKAIHEPAHPGAYPCVFCHSGHFETENPCAYCH